MLDSKSKTVLQVVLNNTSEQDMAMLEFIKAHGNVSGYIKTLIARDMEEAHDRD